jgi:MFS family permease
MPDQARDRRRRAALVAVATLTVMSTMAIAPSLPQMARAFAGMPNAELLVKLTLTIPAIVIAICAPLAGWVIDRFGRLPMLYSSMVLYGAAGASGYFLDSLYGILASRVVLGFAIAGAMTTTQALAGDYFHGEQRSRFAGLQSVVMSFGAMLLVGIGGFIADFSWRGPFMLYLYGWLLIPFIIRHLDEPSRASRQRSDLPDGPFPFGELASAYLIACFSTAMFYMVSAQLPFLLVERGIQSGLLIGLAVGFVQLFSAAGSFFYHRIKTGRGFPAVFAAAFVLLGAGYGMIWASTSYALVLVGAMIAGIGVGLFFPNSTLWALTIAPPALRGRCSGGMSASLNFGQFASPIVLQPVVAAVGLGGSFGVAALILFTVAASLAIVPRGR